MPTIPPALPAWRALFEAQGGLLTSREARAAGLHPQHLARLVERGDIERVQRGVYRLSEGAAFGNAEDLLEVQLRVPYARPCLVSALHLHGLTTTRPHHLQFAVPGNRRFPPLDFPPSEAFYFGEAAYVTGVLELSVAGRTLTTYTPEKTLADLLAYAPKFGRDVYLEGLKHYLRRDPQPGTRTLLDMARTRHVDRELRRDLEVLMHEPDR